MASTEVKLGGAWAAFEQQQVDREAVIDKLCSQLAELTTMHQQLCQDYAQLQVAYQAAVSKSQQTQAEVESVKAHSAELEGQLETSRFMTEELTVTHQDATSQLESSIQRMQQDMELSQQSHLQQMQHVEQQNSELREIVSASMHTKRASTIKLETAMNALNLSRGSAARFIEELEAVKGKVEQLTAERDKALADSVILCQQRDCHADHAQLLTRDNKRLTTQLQAMRLEQSNRDTRPQTDIGSTTTSVGSKPRKLCSDPARPSTMASESVSSKQQRPFKGGDIKNTLHKAPFNLSKGIYNEPSSTNPQTLLKQVQQLRAEGK